VDVIFYFGSYTNLIAKDLVSKLALEAHYHPYPYALGCVNKDAEIRVI
jgi:hypothetical protein